MGIRFMWSDDKAKNGFEWAPPYRIIAFWTLAVATLDVLADLLICNELRRNMDLFIAEKGFHLVCAYWFFTAISVIIYVFEMIDVCKTLKYDEENLYLARFVKSIVLVFEEVPLPLILYHLMDYSGGKKLVNSFSLLSVIKLFTLTWGFVKFMKLRFFWPCLPLNPKHDTRENIRRCFTFSVYRICMIVVNICHIIAVIICFLCLQKAFRLQTERKESKL